MPFPRPTLTTLRAQAMQDITASDLPNADGFLRRAVLRVLAWVQAGMAYLHYGYLDWISQQSTPFTSTGEYLDAWASAAPTPVLRNAPGYASGQGTWPGTYSASNNPVLPSGSICTRDDGVQFQTTAAAAVSSGGTVTAPIQAVVAGSNGNTDSGAPLELTVVITGISTAGTAATAITGGTDLEQDASLRTRMLESYAAPPHGGSASDYVTWALEVPGVTRAWAANGTTPGSVAVYFMMDEAEAAYGGFPQGTNGVSPLDPRAVAATGDQLSVVSYIFPLRPIPMLVWAYAPQAQAQNFTINGLSSLTTAQKAEVSAAITALFLQKDTPLGTTSIGQSDVASAIVAIGGLPSFSITSPSSWPITSAGGYLFTLGTITYT